MSKSTIQKFKDLLDYPGTLGIGVTLLEIAVLVVIYCFNRQEKIEPSQTSIESNRETYIHEAPSSIELAESVDKPVASGNNIRFQHESDIHNYLRNHKFVNSAGDINITEGTGMVLVVNGTILTGAINIHRFGPNQAYFTAHAPVDGTTFRFVVNCVHGTLYCENDGTMYTILNNRNSY